MQSLYLLIPVALLFTGLAIGIFIWAMNHRQFDDLERESKRIFDEKD